MAEYPINKGIGRPVEFKGLKAQYLFIFCGGLLDLFVLFVILYMAVSYTPLDVYKRQVVHSPVDIQPRHRHHVGGRPAQFLQLLVKLLVGHEVKDRQM